MTKKTAAWDLTAFKMPPATESDGGSKLVYEFSPPTVKKAVDSIGGEETMRWLWFSMRETCLMAAVMGYDLGTDEIRELIKDAWLKAQEEKAALGSWVNVGKTAYSVLLHCSLALPSYLCSTGAIQPISEDEYSESKASSWDPRTWMR